MTEGIKAELFLSYLDRILAGEKDLGPVADSEMAGLIRLAQRTVAATAFGQTVAGRYRQSDCCGWHWQTGGGIDRRRVGLCDCRRTGSGSHLPPLRGEWGRDAGEMPFLPLAV